MSADRPLPSSPDAERAVLGSVLLGGVPTFIRLPQALSADDFGSLNAPIFAAMAWLHEERQPIDMLSIVHLLRGQRRGESTLLEAIGGAAYIASLTDMVPDIANVERYADIVIEMAQKRRLIAQGEAIVQEAWDGATKAEDVAAGALGRLGAFAVRESEQARPLGDVVADAFAHQRALSAANKSVAFESGWPTLDDHKVFYPTLIVCSADKGMGKSALMVSLSRSLAQHKHGNVMFSLESQPRELGLRFATIETGIPHRMMRDWRSFSDANRADVEGCQRIASKLPVWVDRGPWSLEGVIREIRRLRATHGIDVAFLDYMQLIESAGRFEREELRLGYAAQQLLRVANELSVAVVAFSQVNSQGDVAYAQSIEKAARVRIHFERPDKDDKHKCHDAVFRILKNNEERTLVQGFAAHFDEPYLTWSEGTCETNKCSLRGNVPLQQALM